MPLNLKPAGIPLIAIPKTIHNNIKGQITRWASARACARVALIHEAALPGSIPGTDRRHRDFLPRDTVTALC